MYYLHCTKKLLDRVKPEVSPTGTGDTRLGNWYATVKFWKPQVALLVSERSLLPLLMPLAPAATLATRFPGHLAKLLEAHGVAADFIAREISRMGEMRYAKTANRSVVGMLNEFSRCIDFNAEARRYGPDDDILLALSLELARVPCGPLYAGPVCPDRALRELVMS